MVREFKLLNENGQEFSLMDIENYCLLTDPSGLGITYKTEYEQLGNTFVENIRRIEKEQIDGLVNFTNYDNYRSLINFIESSEQLQIAYQIPYESGEREFLKDIQIQSITKTQRQLNGIISESIVFDCLSLWYEKNTIIYTIEPATNEIRWNFEWDSRFADYNSRSMEYINEGHTEAPILVEINGHVSNPGIELYVEGQLYQTVSFNIEIAEYEKLLYGTQENNFYIKKQNADGTLEDLYNLSVIDFNNDNVIRIPKNKSCELRLIADTDILNAQVTILAYYKAV